jgi:hypothetical protein
MTLLSKMIVSFYCKESALNGGGVASVTDMQLKSTNMAIDRQLMGLFSY